MYAGQIPYAWSSSTQDLMSKFTFLWRKICPFFMVGETLHWGALPGELNMSWFFSLQTDVYDFMNDNTIHYGGNNRKMKIMCVKFVKFSSKNTKFNIFPWPLKEKKDKNAIRKPKEGAASEWKSISMLELKRLGKRGLLSIHLFKQSLVSLSKLLLLSSFEEWKGSLLIKSKNNFCSKNLKK